MVCLTHLVGTCHGGHGIELAGELVLDGVDLVVLRVHGTDEHVVGDVVQVSAELEPRASHADVVSCALALRLDQNLGGLPVRYNQHSAHVTNNTNSYQQVMSLTFTLEKLAYCDIARRVEVRC